MCFVVLVCLLFCGSRALLTQEIGRCLWQLQRHKRINRIGISGCPRLDGGYLESVLDKGVEHVSSDGVGVGHGFEVEGD